MLLHREVALHIQCTGGAIAMWKIFFEAVVAFVVSFLCIYIMFFVFDFLFLHEPKKGFSVEKLFEKIKKKL